MTRTVIWLMVTVGIVLYGLFISGFTHHYVTIDDVLAASYWSGGALFAHWVGGKL